MSDLVQRAGADAVDAARGSQAGQSPIGGRPADVPSRWVRGDAADTRALLDRRPELEEDRSLVIALAYDEYYVRLAAGEQVDPNEFCARFPRYRASLTKILVLQRFGGELLDEPPSNPNWPQAGETFLGFVLLRELGRGTLARVFLASQPALGHRYVAIKITKHVAAEAKTLGRLTHPNVVPIYSTDEDKASKLGVVCMPYLGCATLNDFIDPLTGPASLPARAAALLEAACPRVLRDVPVEDSRQPAAILRGGTYEDGVCHLAAQLADALAFIHERGIYHLDLKPSNVLLSPDGTPLLLDFNLAFDARLAHRLQGGTIPYMSPEQLHALGSREKDADPRWAAAPSDVYSFGVLLYHLFSGNNPFGELPIKLSLRQATALLLERQRQHQQPLRQCNPRVDRSLAELIDRCLALDPAQRPSMTQVRDRIRVNLKLRWRVRRWIVRHRFAAAGVFCLVFLLCLFVGWHYATRAPYAAREYDRGLAAYRERRYEDALAHLSESIRSNPQDAQAWFARGRVYQRLGDLPLALADFSEADNRLPDGKTKACRGYCSQDHNKAALWYYEQAINAGFREAEVLNNLGYTYLAIGELNKAEKVLKEASELKPELQAVWNNLAKAELRKALQSPGVFPKDGVYAIEAALHGGPPTVDIHERAAMLYAVSARSDPARHELWCERAFAHARAAVRAGLDARELAEDDNLKLLLNERPFKSFLELVRDPSIRIPRNCPTLLDPLPES